MQYQFCIKGKMLLDANHTQDSMAEFKHLQDRVLRAFDPYIVLSCANILYEWSTRVRHSPEEQGQLMRRAMDKYIEVLEADDSNIFAALGIANILAEHNKVTEALEIMKSIKEATPSNIHSPNVMVNLGHMNIIFENYESAINIYEKTIEKYGANLELRLFLAKALYLAKRFDECLKLLKTLAEQHPKDLRVHYDLAMCLYEAATSAFNKDSRKVKETKEAIDNIEQGLRVTNFLLSIQDLTPYLPPNPSKDTKLIMEEMLLFMKKFCDEQKSVLKHMLEKAQDFLDWDQQKEKEHLD